MLAGLEAQLALVTVRDAVRAANRTELCRTLWALADRQACLLHTRGSLSTLVRAARTTRSYKAHITLLFHLLDVGTLHHAAWSYMQVL